MKQELINQALEAINDRILKLNLAKDLLEDSTDLLSSKTFYSIVEDIDNKLCLGLLTSKDKGITESSSLFSQLEQTKPAEKLKELQFVMTSHQLSNYLNISKGSLANLIWKLGGKSTFLVHGSKSKMDLKRLMPAILKYWRSLSFLKANTRTSLFVVENWIRLYEASNTLH